MSDETPEMIIHDAPKEVQEVPDNCDTCGAALVNLNPIRQRRQTTFGFQFLVIGYRCEACGTDHLYR